MLLGKILTVYTSIYLIFRTILNITNKLHINILWINVCLHMLDVYDKGSMFLFLVIYICMINRKTFQGFKAK